MAFLDCTLAKLARLVINLNRLLCFGHTHKPWQRVVDGIRFINTGSIGRPKDGDARACYVMLSMEEPETRVEIVRVAYDVDEAIRGIRASELPTEFADVLKSGGTGALTSSAAS